MIKFLDTGNSPLTSHNDMHDNVIKNVGEGFSMLLIFRTLITAFFSKKPIFIVMLNSKRWNIIVKVIAFSLSAAHYVF